MATNRAAKVRIERDEKARLRAELADAKREYARAALAIKTHRSSVVVERRRQAKALRDDLASIRRGYRGVTRELMLALAARREAYRAWWREILAETQRRQDELHYLRDILAARRLLGPKEIKAAVSVRLKQLEAERRTGESSEVATRSELSARLKTAKRGVREADVDKQLAGRRRPSPVRVSPAERKSEFFDAVESNLPVELAPWYRDHSRLFAARPNESPDSVAERVVEAFEAEPESVERHASERADARVRELLQEAGLYG